MIKTLKDHTGSVNSVEFSPDDNLLATGSSDNSVKVYLVDGNDFKLVESFENHSDEVNKVSFNFNGSILASCSKDSTVKVNFMHYKSDTNHYYSYKDSMNEIIRSKFDRGIVSEMIDNLSLILKGPLNFYQKLNLLHHYHPHICAIRSGDTGVLIEALQKIEYKSIYYLGEI